MEPSGLGVDEPFVVLLDACEVAVLLELVRSARALGGGTGVQIEVDRRVRRPREGGVDPPDVLQGPFDVDIAVGDRRGLIGEPGIGVSVGDDELPVGEGGLDRPREVIRVVCGVQEQLRQRIGVVGLDRPVDGVTVPAVGGLTGEHRVGIHVVERLPHGRLTAPVEPLQRDQHGRRPAR